MIDLVAVSVRYRLMKAKKKHLLDKKINSKRLTTYLNISNRGSKVYNGEGCKNTEFLNWNNYKKYRFTEMAFEGREYDLKMDHKTKS